MPRGNTPRQPSRSGRHEGARRSGLPAAKPPSAHLSPSLSAAKTQPAGPKKKTGGYNPIAPDRVQSILDCLNGMYPGVTCALTHSSAWELVVATILSAQCTDVRVNMVTPLLFAKYPAVQDFLKIEPEALEPDIRSTGFFRNKSKSIIGAARKVVSDFDGIVPQTMEELLTLPGVARKTANVVLGTWFKKNEGVVVDTHVTRIARRLELTKHEDAQKIEQDLMQIIPREKWTEFSHQIIWHGRKLCVARGPKCPECKIETLCHAADKTWSTVEMHKGAK